MPIIIVVLPMTVMAPVPVAVRIIVVIILELPIQYADFAQFTGKGSLLRLHLSHDSGEPQSACRPSTLFSSNLPVLASTPTSCVTPSFLISKE